jgi:hypothetical protein
MKTLFRLTWLFVVGIFLLTTAAHHEQLYILPSSTLSISGTSNVTDFDCCCDENFTPIPYEVESLAATQLKVSNSQLRIPVQELDCGNRIMNKDMREALRADEHPYIDIRPGAIQLHQAPPINSGQWVTLSATAEVSLAGVTKNLDLHVKARRLADNRWRIRSQKELCMLDFEVEPPTAMGGLIKVRDEITIHFDLLVENR